VHADLLDIIDAKSQCSCLVAGVQGCCVGAPAVEVRCNCERCDARDKSLFSSPGPKCGWVLQSAEFIALKRAA
jgi:hypothetical protein